MGLLDANGFLREALLQVNWGSIVMSVTLDFVLIFQEGIFLVVDVQNMLRILGRHKINLRIIGVGFYCRGWGGGGGYVSHSEQREWGGWEFQAPPPDFLL